MQIIRRATNSYIACSDSEQKSIMVGKIKSYADPTGRKALERHSTMIDNKLKEEIAELRNQLNLKTNEILTLLQKHELKRLRDTKDGKIASLMKAIRLVKHPGRYQFNTSPYLGSFGSILSSRQ